MFNGKHTVYVIILFFLIVVGLLFLGRGITGFATINAQGGSLSKSQESIAIGALLIVFFSIILFDFRRMFKRK